MGNYFRNIEHLCRQHKLDLNSLAIKVGMDFSDLRKPTPDDLATIADHFKISIDVLVRGHLSSIEEIKSKKIKLLILDVDGVMTDAGMYYSESGDEYKKFNAKDGIVLKHLGEKGIKTGIISHGINKNLITRRASLLKIDFIEVSNLPKLDVTQAWCAQLGIELENVAYIGDDFNDEELMKKVGLSACPADAAGRIKMISHIILQTKGGEGCIREFVDNYLS
ncbi:MAG: HAD hydrolase family protein [Bacteroidota bacterium]